MDSKKDYLAPRVARFQVVWPGRNDHDLWLAISEECQRGWNLCWRVWVLWHEQNGTVPRIKDFQERQTAWREHRGDKPEKFGEAVPKACSHAIYHRLSDELPSLNKTVMTMIINGWQKELYKRKAARGSWAAWMQILLSKQKIPDYTHPQPIPLKNTPSGLDIRKPSGDGDYKVAIRIDRIERGKKRAVSTQHVLTLKSRTRKMKGQRAILDRVASGEYKLCACNLHYNDRKREWDFLLTYRMPKFDRKVSAETTAVLMPAKTHPWVLRVGGRSFWVDGRGRVVGETRRRIMGQRRNRQATYRVAGSANRGRGRKRALAPMDRLSKAWKDFVRLVNHTTTRRVVDVCTERGVGRLIYLQPAEAKRDARFLSWTGKQPDDRDASGWDWHQVATYLGYKCQDVGILLDVKKRQPKRQKEVAA